MKIVFAGPTIPISDVQRILTDAETRPPARAGDVYAACRDGATAIGLIDGFFEGVPSVWHKEILWALDQGIAVYGASSMGALRAAELHAFGMVGVGAIFEAYRDGLFEDDDEVALRHGPAELGYVPLSEPMVNIRASLDRAVEAGIMDGTAARHITQVAKDMHFPDRTWDGLLAQGGADLEPLRAWLPTRAVDQKRLDARDMLLAMTDIAPPAPDFTFQHTVMWENLKQRVGPSRDMILVLDQVRRDPARYSDLRQRAVATLETKTAPDVPQADVDRALTRFRADHKLYTAAALDTWLVAKGLDLTRLKKNIMFELQSSAIITENYEAYQSALIRFLKQDGAYDALKTDARHLAAQLDRAGVDLPTPQDLEMTPATLLMWYFEQACGLPVPDDLDAYVRQNDFADRAAFEQFMARTYILWQDDG